MIIVTDLDGVITVEDEGFYPRYWERMKVDEDYVETLRLAKKLGHKIIIHTSRMSSEAFAGTIECLNRNDVPFDAIHFDKPMYDVIVQDDKALTKHQLKTKLKLEKDSEAISDE